MRKFLTIPILGLVALLMMGASSCDPNTSARSDETVCVYDGGDNSSQKLKYQIFPGENPRDSNSDDEIVRIPTSFRFYAAARDRQVADAGAPEFYTAYARGATPVQVEGQFKFRFNAQNACEWYARHGRRNANNGDLGFNARSSEAASSFSPWVRWLNENFGAVAIATTRTASRDFTWPELVYGTDPEATKRDVPADVAYGRQIGRVFSERLRASLGGDFFCGTNPEVWGADDSINQECPPIYFEMRRAQTEEPKLMEERAKTELLKAQLENAAAQAQLRQSRVATTRQDERTQQQVLRAQIETARLKALADIDIQKCIILARRGLDCDGKYPSRIVLGQSG